ncbi:Dol-P-Man:Man 5 GlcNAc 2 PP-Dol alpha-13-mannosyltransferase [Taenia solium]|eukprot:TsM_000491300 transcript=TsM_000491300 gene=TsM_000491300
MSQKNQPDLVSDTEIDWVAYMQQSENFLNGTRDYDQLIGQTGPCVYPAGHIYIYSLLYFLTDHGRNIFAAQYLFAILYAITMILVSNIYRKFKKVPLFPILILSFASYRVHSIYLLRLFNDPWAMFFLYASINWCLYNHFSCAAVFFSIAVGVKMNILLFAPGFLLVLLKHRGVYETLGHLAECATIQVLLGTVFLFRNSEAYFTRAFDFSRQFMYKWTVNWRIISESLFLDRRFHAALLVLHLLLLSFFLIKFIRSRGGFQNFLQPLPPSQEQKIAAEDILYPLFVSNFIGIAFSRSLHYQFYVWYYHSIPFILWSMRPLSDSVRLLLFGLIEMSWNVYPSTVLSSATLHVCHAIILLGLALQPLSNTSVPIGQSKGRKMKKQ